MKKYKEYMDTIRASGSLHQRLAGLEEPGKRPIPWKRYGSLAAALVLVLGLGGYGYAHYQNMIKGPTGEAFLEHTQAFNPADAPDIATEDPDAACEPAEKTLGGYDVQEERGGVPVTCHYILPYIEYGITGNRAELDWGLPDGALRRDLPQDEIIALMGGEEAVYTHLDWGGYDLSGWAAWERDGTFWGAYIRGVEPVYETDYFEFAVTTYQLPPTCVIYPNSVTQEVRGLTVTADKSDFELESGPAPERRVSFFKGNCGYRFEASAYDKEQAELLVSRLVCRMADEGLGLEPEEQYAEMRSSTCEFCGQDIVPGTKHFHLRDEVCSNCGQTVPAGTKHSHTYIDADSASTEAYDPNEAADPFYNAPAVSAPPIPVSDAPIMYTCGTCGRSVPEGGVHFHLIPNGDGTCTCDSCGVTMPEGQEHYHGTGDSMCAGYPLPVVCAICGGTYPAGTEHSHEVCGLPLAPSDTATETISD